MSFQQQGFQSNAFQEVVPGASTAPPEDAWDWFGDEHGCAQVVIPDKYLQSSVPPLLQDIWLEDVVEEIDDEWYLEDRPQDAAVVAADQPPEQPFWDDDVEDEIWWYVEDLANSGFVDIPPPDGWVYEDDTEDPWEGWAEDSAANGGFVDAPPDDGWYDAFDWDGEIEDEWWIDDRPQDAVVTTQPPEDLVYDDDTEDEPWWFIEDLANTGFVDTPQPDAWPWDQADDTADEWESWYLESAANPGFTDQPPSDAWPHEQDEFDDELPIEEVVPEEFFEEPVPPDAWAWDDLDSADEWDTWADDSQANSGFVDALPADGWSWDDDFDDEWLLEDRPQDAAVVAAQQSPEDAWDFIDQDTEDDWWWWQERGTAVVDNNCYIQDVSLTGTGSTLVLTINNVGPQSYLNLFFVDQGNATNTVAVSDSRGDTFLQTGPYATSGTTRLSWWRTVTFVHSGTHVITCTPSGSGFQMGAFVIEVASGVPPTSMYDSSQGPATLSAPPAGVDGVHPVPNLTPAGTNDTIVAAIVETGAFGTVVPGSIYSAGFSSPLTLPGTANRFALEFRTQPGHGVTTVNWTDPNGPSNAYCFVAYALRNAQEERWNDAWWEEELDDEFGADEYGLEDFQLQADQPPEDPFVEDDAGEDWWADDYQLIDNNPVLSGEDSWEHFADPDVDDPVESWQFDATVGPDNNPAIAPLTEEWDWWEGVDDEPLVDERTPEVVVAAQPVEDPVPEEDPGDDWEWWLPDQATLPDFTQPLGPDDPWDTGYDDTADEWDWWLDAVTPPDVVAPPAVLQPTDIKVQRPSRRNIRFKWGFPGAIEAERAPGGRETGVARPSHGAKPSVLLQKLLQRAGTGIEGPVAPPIPVLPTVEPTKPTEAPRAKVRQPEPSVEVEKQEVPRETSAARRARRLAKVAPRRHEREIADRRVRRLDTVRTGRLAKIETIQKQVDRIAAQFVKVQRSLDRARRHRERLDALHKHLTRAAEEGDTRLVSRRIEQVRLAQAKLHLVHAELAQLGHRTEVSRLKRAYQEEAERVEREMKRSRNNLAAVYTAIQLLLSPGSSWTDPGDE